MPYSIIRSGPQSTSSTPQSEASNSNQSQKDQELQIQNSSDGLAPSPFSANGAIGSGPSTSNLENSLQKAQENFIKGQIEVRKNLDSESTQLTSSTLLCDASKKRCVWTSELDRWTLTACMLQYRRYFCWKLIFSCNHENLHTLQSPCLMCLYDSSLHDWHKDELVPGMFVSCF